MSTAVIRLRHWLNPRGDARLKTGSGNRGRPVACSPSVAFGRVISRRPAFRHRLGPGVSTVLADRGREQVNLIRARRNRKLEQIGVWENVMNNTSIFTADRMTHLKIVVVALIGATVVAGIGIAVRETDGMTASNRFEASVIRPGATVAASNGRIAIR